MAASAELPETYEVIGDAVVLPTGTSSPAALQTAPSGTELRLFAKTGLLLRAGMQLHSQPEVTGKTKRQAGGETLVGVN